MMKKIPYKIIVASALLTMTTTSVVSPVAAFASEIEQPSTGDMSLSANEVKMKEALQKAGLFAKSMNEYSYLLINNPDVNFEGITINGYADLPNKIVQDQRNARAHAVTWNTQVKRQLLDTLTGIVEYDTMFDNYYDTIIDAINTGDGDTLKEGITDLRSEIQQNQKTAQNLIAELTKLRDNMGEDVRAFGSNKEQLYSILKNQTAGLEDDQKRLDEVLGQVNYYKKLESDGFTTMKVGVFGLWWIGGIIVGTARDNLGKLEPYLAEVRQTVDNKTTLNRVIEVAHNNTDQMHKSIDNAINALEYMHTQWTDLDNQYAGVLQKIDNAAGKADQNKFAYLKPTLKTAKDLWKRLNEDAVIIKEGIKELKVEPVTPQK
ncbi:hemolysin BL binding component B [Bacillus pseudomycoides]|uniref:Hemolysin n=1 Tax=Bacillus pseudomycoides TaxID=64104 RepID=A0A2B5H988_9BACI|nr:HBL/NHE enterotoxin family protein [Bacillus pseudomycoides]PEA80339.1 hemolysin [Bacillus pseudomycoides]PEM57769.1 hemolysin [Bacillus pseudomycoides]PFZ04087.1 hemolysin [Bacillus pseudomycoides]PFZ11636.1 hemolysin [Bacillus pseudomycoides]PGC32491.1 hemolysin [Bacillus pseudomycoides]